MARYTKANRAYRRKLAMADELRTEFTSGEFAAWAFLKQNLMGVHFTRECVVRGYIVDFGCRTMKLAVEIDGGVHDTDNARKYDWQRDQHIGLEGWAVIRLSNRLVMRHPSTARRIVENAIQRKKNQPHLAGRIYGTVLTPAELQAPRHYRSGDYQEAAYASRKRLESKAASIREEVRMERLARNTAQTQHSDIPPYFPPAP